MENSDPLCNKQVKVTYNGNSIVLAVRDKCPSCPSNNIDISAPAFLQLTGNLGLGRIAVTWEFINGGSTTTGSTTSSSTSGSTSGSTSCTKKATVDAGQGCWDVWTSKCGNTWNENQFYLYNPGVTCTLLQIGQQLCCS